MKAKNDKVLISLTSIVGRPKIYDMQNPSRLENTRFSQAILLNKMVWMALTCSVIAYGLVGYVLGHRTLGADARSVQGGIQSVGLSLAVFGGLISLIFRRIYFSETRLKKSTQSTEQLMKRWTLGNIICWSLNDFVAIAGLLMTFFSGDYHSQLPYVAAALLLNAYMFPKAPEFLEAALTLKQ